MKYKEPIFVHVHARIEWADGDLDYLSTASPVLDETFPNGRLQYETKVGKHKIFLITTDSLWERMTNFDRQAIIDSAIDALEDNFNDIDFGR